MTRYDIRAKTDSSWRGRLLSAASFVCLAALLPLSASLAATPAFLLIDGADGAGLPRLSGCDREMTALHARLDQVPEDNYLLVAPTADVLRRELLTFADRTHDAPRVFVFCGYGAASDGRLFALPADAPAQGDLGRTAIAAAAFSRLLAGRDGAVLLDLHPAGQAGNVTKAVDAWRGDAGLAGHRLAQVETDAATAPLIARLTNASSFAPDQLPILASVSPPTPAAAPANENAAAGSLVTLPPKPDDQGTSAPGAIGAGATGSGATSTSSGLPLVLAPAALPAKPAEEVRVIHPSSAIRRIQVALLARGLFAGRVSGINNPATRAAIRHFQSTIGHPPTGTLTPDELTQLTSG